MFCRWHVCVGKKRGDAVGKTKRGKGTKLMVVADGQGIPVGISLHSASPAEVTLVEETLDTVQVNDAQLVRLIAETVGSKAKIVHIRPGLALLLARLMGYIVRDVVLTRNEIEGLMAGLLVSEGRPTGQTRLSHWLEHNRERVGTRYTSELQRHYR